MNLLSKFLIPTFFVFLLTFGVPSFVIFQSASASTISASVHIISSISTGDSSNLMAYDSKDKTIFVVNEGNGTAHTRSVSVIDATSNKVLSTIAIPPRATEIAYDPTNDNVYVRQRGSFPTTGPVIFVISGSTDKVIQTLSTCDLSASDIQQYETMAYDPANGNMYIVNCPGSFHSITMIDSATNEETQIKTGFVPTKIAYNPSDQNMYVAVGTCTTRGKCVTTPYVAIIRSSSNTVAANVTLTGATPETCYGCFLSYNPANKEMYVTSDYGTLYMIKGQQLVATTHLFTCSSFYANCSDWMAYNAGNQEMYVSNATNSVLMAVSSSTNQVISKIPIAGAFTFAVNPVNHDVYVAGSTIYVVSPTNHIVSKFATKSISGGGSAIFNPVGGTMYVSIMNSPGYVDVLSS